MSGIVQKKSTPESIASPPSDSVFIGVNGSGVLYTKSGSTVTEYPFPYTGDALIDGSLNIDFTDTLNTVMGEVDFSSSPDNDQRYIGDFMGYTYREGDLFGMAGLFDGVLDVDSGSFQFPYKQWVVEVQDEDSGTFLGSNYGIFGVGSAGNVVSRPVHFYNGVDTFELSLSSDFDGGWEFGIFKEGPNGDVTIGTDDEETGFVISNDVDDEDVVLLIEDNDEDELFAFLGQFITSQNILNNRNYVDDAAAAADNVPEGAFYHTDGVLKIRRPLP
jgi:hypothetical protein